MSTLDLWAQFLPDLVQGAIVSVELLALATAISATIGLIGALSILWAPAPVRLFWTAYISVVRSTPSIANIFVIYYGLPEIGIVLPGIPAGAAAIGFVGGAFFIEIFRGGIESVDRGQAEAGTALGLSRVALMRLIILPQAIPIMIPPSVNLIMDLLKTTAVVVAIGVADIMYETYNAVSQTYRAMELYFLAGLVYLAIALPLMRIAARFEKVAARYRR